MLFATIEDNKFRLYGHSDDEILVETPCNYDPSSVNEVADVLRSTQVSEIATSSSIDHIRDDGGFDGGLFIDMAFRASESNPNA